MTKEIMIQKIIEDGEQNFSHARQIQRAGDLNALTVDDLERLARRLGVHMSEPTAEESAYYEAKSLYDGIKALGQILAEEGEGNLDLAEVAGEMMTDSEKGEIISKIESKQARLAEIEDAAREYGRFIGVHFDGALAK